MTQLSRDIDLVALLTNEAHICKINALPQGITAKSYGGAKPVPGEWPLTNVSIAYNNNTYMLGKWYWKNIKVDEIRPDAICSGPYGNHPLYMNNGLYEAILMPSKNGRTAKMYIRPAGLQVVDMSGKALFENKLFNGMAELNEIATRRDYLLTNSRKEWLAGDPAKAENPGADAAAKVAKEALQEKEQVKDTPKVEETKTESNPEPEPEKKHHGVNDPIDPKLVQQTAESLGLGHLHSDDALNYWSNPGEGVNLFNTNALAEKILSGDWIYEIVTGMDSETAENYYSLVDDEFPSTAYKRIVRRIGAELMALGRSPETMYIHSFTGGTIFITPTEDGELTVKVANTFNRGTSSKVGHLFWIHNQWSTGKAYNRLSNTQFIGPGAEEVTIVGTNPQPVKFTEVETVAYHDNQYIFPALWKLIQHRGLDAVMSHDNTTILRTIGGKISIYAHPVTRHNWTQEPSIKTSGVQVVGINSPVVQNDPALRAMAAGAQVSDTVQRSGFITPAGSWGQTMTGPMFGWNSQMFGGFSTGGLPTFPAGVSSIPSGGVQSQWPDLNPSLQKRHDIPLYTQAQWEMNAQIETMRRSTSDIAQFTAIRSLLQDIADNGGSESHRATAQAMLSVLHLSTMDMDEED